MSLSGSGVRSAGPRAGLFVLALTVIIALCALGAPAGAAGSTTEGAALSLLSQSEWVTPNQAGTANFQLELSGTAPNGWISVTVYNKVKSRSGPAGFLATLTSTPATGILWRSTQPVSLTGLPAGPDGGAELTLGVVPQPTSASGAQTVDLDCDPLIGSCQGVYPVVVALSRQSGGPVIAHFTTYLTYVQGASSNPLRFAWVVPVSAPVGIRADAASPTKALALPAKATVDDLVGLVEALGQHPQVPVTVEATPETVQALERSGTTAVRAVGELADLSANQQQHQFAPQPFVPVNLGSLAGAGVGTEIVAQMGTGHSILKAAGIHVGTDVWVAAGPTGQALGRGLAEKGVDATEAVVPDSDLTPAEEEDGITWSQPFELDFDRGSSVRAAASDSALSAQFTADPGDPALAATQILADLAFIHFELPNAPEPRGVVAVPPSSWTPNATFVDTLLDGLTGNPDVSAVTLDGLFSAVTPGGNAAPTDRHLADSGPGPLLSPALARAVVRARLRLTAFDGAAPGAPVLTNLDQIILAAESSDLGASGERAGVAAFEHQLSGQLSLVQLATNRTITLTARTAPIPITILSSAPYQLRGRLVLSSDKFEFPHGATRPFPVDHNTNSVRVDVEARTTGDLPLEVVLTSPNGKLVITAGRLTVRSTATSVVGVVLTLAAAAVLLWWWARTWRAGRRRRRGAQSPGRSRRSAVPVGTG